MLLKNKPAGKSWKELAKLQAHGGSNVKNERTNILISFWKETIPEVVLFKTCCFDLVQNLLSWTE